jgi:hypothetical protein
VPLTPVQRQWYQRILTRDEGADSLLSFTQLMAVMMQLQKVLQINDLTIKRCMMV